MTSPITAYPGPLARGARDTNPSGPVHRLQGWLHLHGYDPGPVDGDFGPRTEAAYVAYQGGFFAQGGARGLPLRALHALHWETLTAPLARAMEPLRIHCDTCNHDGETHRRVTPPCTCLGEAVAATARQWLAQRVGGGPLRELPGNSGPVVEACTRWLAERDRLPCFCRDPEGSHHERRSYTAGQPEPVREVRCIGNRGLCRCRSYAPNWRLSWCAGWVSTVLRQACESLGVDMPIAGSLSCDELARQALEQRLMFARVHGGEWMDAPEIQPRPGDLFLVRGKAPGDWVHCGVVLEVHQHMSGTVLTTAEGNTNNRGDRNGDSLLEHRREVHKLDFLCWRGS